MHGGAGRPPTVARVQRAAARMQNLGDLAGGGMDDLQKDLKQAAAKKLGANLQELQSPEDLATSQRRANAFADLLAAKKREVEARKAEIGEEAALDELEQQIRSAGGPNTETRAWVVGDAVDDAAE